LIEKGTQIKKINLDTKRTLLMNQALIVDLNKKTKSMIV